MKKHQALLAWAPLGLRARFMVMATLAILSFGATNMFVFETIASRMVEAELRDRATTLGRRLSDEAVNQVLLNDRSGLQRVLEVTLDTDPFCDYAFIVGRDGKVMASTFHGGMPNGLVEANSADGAEHNIVQVSDRGTDFIDVASPMLRGDLGVVRVGARMDRVVAGLVDVRHTVVTMVIVMLIVSLIGAYLTADRIAGPLERLASKVRIFDPAEAPSYSSKIVAPSWEIEELVRSFDRMSMRLRQFHVDRQAIQERIVRAERLATVGALAAGIAHDVNNPLAGIRNCLKALARDPADTEQTRSYAQMMIEATRAIERSVRGLMQVAASTRPQPDRVDVAPLLERTVLLVRHRFDRSGVFVETRLTGQPPAIRTDEGLLQQVLVNLLLNACDASPEGETVTLEAEPSADCLLLRVTDRGPGVSPEVADRIFEPFVTTKGERGGTGLGLAMARTVVADLDGELQFESTEGEGARFTVSLPLEGPPC